MKDAAWFEGIAPSLTEEEAKVLTVLGMVHASSASGVVEVARYARFVTSSQRAHTVATVRPVLDALKARGLVASNGSTYGCAPEPAIVMRWAVARPWYTDLGNGVRVARHDPWLVPWIALFRRDATSLAALHDLAERSPIHAAAIAVQVLTAPFDAEWISSLADALRHLLCELALVEAARIAFPIGELFAYLMEDPERRAASATARSALADIAVLRGDLAGLRALTDHAVAGALAPALRAALAFVEGRRDEALREAEVAVASFDKSQHPGVVMILEVLALMGGKNTPSAIRKLLAVGARSGAPFEGSFKKLRWLAAQQSSPLGGRTAKTPGLVRPPSDCMERLVGAFCARSAEVDGFELIGLDRACAERVGRHSEDGYAWLSRQYHFAERHIRELLPEPFQSRTPLPPISADGAPSLFMPSSRRSHWEVALEKLEAVAGVPKPSASADAELSERLIWRTSSRLGDVDPYLQKRASSTGAWTGGRKLAIKHLLSDAGLRASLPPEDRRVAEHAHEERSYSYGYPDVTYAMRPSAWLALVGHPRVFVGDRSAPTEVVLGAAKITVRSRAEGIRVETEPPGLREGIQVKESAGRLVVYAISAAQAPVLAVIGAGLTFPVEARAQCLGVLDRLAHLMPIDSTEESAARLVPADPKPYLRLVPSQSGLSVTLHVRPLGPNGPHADPADGATTLVGSIAGEVVRTERDFEQEERAATRALSACKVLAGHEAGDFAWLLPEPVQSLELVSALRTLGDAVTVEWPHGAPLKLRERIGRSKLHGGIRRDGGWLAVDARLAVDAELSVELEELLHLLSASPGRFLRLGEGDYVELEEELREALDAVASARAARKSAAGVSLPLAAISVVQKLGEPGSGLSLDEATRDWARRVESALARRFSVPRGLRAELRDYQLEGFRWLARLAELELGACLADDMGLGKTVQLIALLLHRAKGGPALVVAPTSVCDNWRREIERFGPSLRVRAYWGPERDGILDGLRGRDVVLTSYAILLEDAGALAGIDWATAILDEAQLIKNAETQRAKAAFGLRAKVRVAATGTPVENHASDLHSLFQFLNPGLLGARRDHEVRLGPGSDEGHRGLRSLIRPFVLRRTKAEVLSDLPPLTEITHTVTLSRREAALYEAVRKSALAKLGRASSEPGARIQVLAELTRLRRLCCHPELVAPGSNLPSSKLEAFVELAEELVHGGHRILVFSQFTDVLAYAKQALDDRGITYQYLDGSTPQRERAALVESFQGGEGDAFLISLKAGGFGLNLTGADYVIHLDPWWNPAVESQASDRAHRIGQTRPVTVYRLVTEGTIEARIVELHRDKRLLAESILDGTDRAAKLSADDLRGLLEGSLGVAASEPPPSSAPPRPAQRASRSEKPRPLPATPPGGLTLERYASVVARLSQGESPSRVLRENGLTEQRWSASQETWARTLQGDRALAARFVALLGEHA